MNTHIKLKILSKDNSNMLNIPDFITNILDKKTLEIKVEDINPHLNLLIVYYLHFLLNQLWLNRINKINFLKHNNNNYLYDDTDKSIIDNISLIDNETFLSLEKDYSGFYYKSLIVNLYLFDRLDFFYDKNDINLNQSINDFGSQKLSLYLIEYLDRRVTQLLYKLSYENRLLKNIR